MSNIKEFLALLSLTFCLLSCRQTGQFNGKGTKSKISPNDTSLIAVLPFDTTQNWLFNGAKPDVLSKSDFATIESLMSKCITTYNKEQEKIYKENKPTKNYLLDFKNIKRQYIAVINNKGEREVWINCFCDDFHTKWREEILMVKDGGVCYYNLKVNLTNKKYYNLIVNGVG